MRLGCQNQRERLKRRGDVEFRIDERTATAFDLAEVINVTFRRDGPENVSRVWTTQLRSPRQIVDVQFDARATASGALHLCFAFEARQQSGAAKLDGHLLFERIGNGDGLSFNIPLRTLLKRRVNKR